MQLHVRAGAGHPESPLRTCPAAFGDPVGRRDRWRVQVSDDRPAAQPAQRAGSTPEADGPVTFKDLFAIREYRAIYVSLVVN